MPLIPDAKLRAQFYPQVKPLLAEAPDEATQVAAIEAAGYIPGNEQEIFAALGEVIQKREGAPRAAAIRSIDRIPAAKWDPAAAESLAKAVVKLVEGVPADQRTTPAAIDAIQFGNDLAGGLPPAQGAPIRKALRELGVRIVLIKTLPEQMSYDLRYFVAEAGKPVEIVLENPDTMPHNIVFTTPGAMQEVALQGGAMPQLADPAVKPYVPDSPKVLSASRAAEAGESTKLSFQAPKEPGEYPFVCTFPGHWVRMYGVMVVVDDIEKFDQSPVAPKDPVLNKPFESQKTDPSQVQAAHEHAH